MSGVAEELEQIAQEAREAAELGLPEGKRLRKVRKPTVVTDELIAEEIYDPEVGRPQYQVYLFEKDRFEVRDWLYFGEEDEEGRAVVYFPVFDDHLRKGSVLVPTGIKEGTLSEALDLAWELIKLGYDPVESVALARLITHIVVSSWWLDRFYPLDEVKHVIGGMGRFAPIIAPRGPSGTGKGRFANLLRLISYRPFFTMATRRIPSLYRPLDVWQGTLVMDEADFRDTGEYSELTHFLNCRATGTPIARQNPDNPRVSNVFESFGLSIVAQRRQFDDTGTEGRTIPYYSERTEKELPTVETDEMIERGLELQNRLLYLRLKLWRDVVIDKAAWLEGVSDPRLNAALLPLMALAEHEPKALEAVRETISEVEEVRIKAKSLTDDGQVIGRICDLVSEGCFNNWNRKLYVCYKEWDEENQTHVLKPLTPSKLAQELGWGAKYVRKVLASLRLADPNLPTIVKLKGRSVRPIWFASAKLEKLAREYVPSYEPDTIIKVAGGEEEA